MNVKVRIVKPMLRPMGHDEALQRIAIVYVDREEYRVFAPAKAEGPAIEWLDQAFVRQPDTTMFGAELEADNSNAEFVIKCVRAELEKVALETAGPAPLEVAEDFPFDAIQLLCTRFHEVTRQLR